MQNQMFCHQSQHYCDHDYYDDDQSERYQVSGKAIGRVFRQNLLTIATMGGVVAGLLVDSLTSCGSPQGSGSENLTSLLIDIAVSLKCHIKLSDAFSHEFFDQC